MSLRRDVASYHATVADHIIDAHVDIILSLQHARQWPETKIQRCKSSPARRLHNECALYCITPFYWHSCDVILYHIPLNLNLLFLF